MVKNIITAPGGQGQFFDNPLPHAGVTFRVILPQEAEPILP
ncbi:MAG: hypothetical protein AB1491_02280 [Thermodesulfobacteriota bacterium]